MPAAAVVVALPLAELAGQAVAALALLAAWRMVSPELLIRVGVEAVGIPLIRLVLVALVSLFYLFLPAITLAS
jgi:hypothetical protein